MGHVEISHFKERDKLLHLASPITMKEAQSLVGQLGFWRQLVWVCYSSQVT